MNIQRRSFVNATLTGAAAALLPVRCLWADSAGSSASATEIAARTGFGRSISLTASDIKDLDASLRGDLIRAGDANRYDCPYAGADLNVGCWRCQRAGALHRKGAPHRRGYNRGSADH